MSFGAARGEQVIFVQYIAAILKAGWGAGPRRESGSGIVKKDTYPKVRYISMIAKEIDTNVS